MARDLALNRTELINPIKAFTADETLVEVGFDPEVPGPSRVNSDAIMLSIPETRTQPCLMLRQVRHP